MTDLRETLLAEHSKAQTLRIVDQIGSSKKRFAELMTLFFANEKIVSARAAWVVSYIAEAYPRWIQPHLTPMLENLRRPVHDAIKRNTLKLVQDAEMTEDQMGLAADLCFPIIPDPTEPPAVRAYALTICHRICKVEPALGRELKLVLDSCYANSPAAVQSRAKRILRELD